MASLLTKLRDLFDLSCAVMSDQAPLSRNYLGDVLHPADDRRLRENPNSFSEARDNIEQRDFIFKIQVKNALDRGHYSRIARGVGFFVSLYHSMNEEELADICCAKELMEDELTDLTTGLQSTSANIELHKIKLRRPHLSDHQREIYEGRVAAGKATLANDLDYLSRLLQDIGLLVAIEDEET